MPSSLSHFLTRVSHGAGRRHLQIAEMLLSGLNHSTMTTKLLARNKTMKSLRTVQQFAAVSKSILRDLSGNSTTTLRAVESTGSPTSPDQIQTSGYQNN